MYGIITGTDALVIEHSLDKCINTFKNNLSLLEIGVCHGDTSRSIRDYLNNANVNFKYYGVDSGKECRESPFPECHMLWGQSEEIYHQCPDDLHWIFIDGCHCNNHVLLDFCNYSCKVVLGGFVVFHDVNPKNQFKLDYQGHGPKHYHEFGTAAVTALKKLGLSQGYRTDWTLVEQQWDDQDWGGTAVYQRAKEYDLVKS